MANRPSQQSGASIKQEREAQRAAKVEAFKLQRAKEQRNRRLGIAGAIVGGLAVVALIAVAIFANYKEPVDPDTISIEGLEHFDGLTAVHIDPTPVDYEETYKMSPPAGGDHWGAWLNCGVYDQPQQNENAVHSLEHGAVWVTYDPELVTGAALDKLRDSVPDTYSIVSPYPGLGSPVVISAWANQVKLDSVDDPRLADFVTKFWKAGEAPEIGASCAGALEGPGRVA